MSTTNDGGEPYSGGIGSILPSGRVCNPLADDGDAFRLMVKLRIDVAHARDYVVSGLGSADSMRRENGDDCAATRRAIVRVAAEIGRDKETPNSHTEIFTSLGAKGVPGPGDNQPKEE